MPLYKIENKILSGKRISPDDALVLFNCDDIHTLGRLANHVAVRTNGNNAYFIQNHHINPTNICVNRCKFCAFSRSKGDKGAYELSIPDVIRKLRVKNSDISSHKAGIKKNLRIPAPVTRHPFREVHIVGGLHPDWSLDYYLDLITKIKTNYSDIHIKAFTAVEIDYFSKISGRSLKNVLLALKEAGLETMPGGGAEIFNNRIRNRLCPEKISGGKWLKIMKTAHSVGIKTNATMLYGHIENYEHRIEHMLKLRDIQDETGGFQAFIPLAFHPLNTKIAGAKYTSGIDDLKTVAVSRLFLDNIPHIKAYWIMLGEKIAQLALLFGADDLDGTIIEERITHSAGALSGTALTKNELINLIRKAGKVPVERDSYYKPVH
ncbi:MAG: aminofutalosine synthase MqnE [Nitrospirota bacterium]